MFQQNQQYLEADERAPSRAEASLMASATEQSITKETRTGEELSDLVRAHVEKYHRGPLDGAQFIKIIPTQPTTDGVNWRIAHSGQAGGHSIALDEAEAELTRKYSLVG